MIYLNYKDVVSLVDTVIDDYGAERVGTITEVPALYIQNTGWSHANNQTNVDSDGEIYIDPENAVVIANFYRLEDMLVIANPFGSDRKDAWYRIIGVTVAQDKLLTNGIDNIRLQLKKTTEIISVS